LLDGAGERPAMIAAMSAHLKWGLIVATMSMVAVGCVKRYSADELGSPGNASNGSSSAATSGAGCSKDADCKGDRVCDEGECVGPGMSLEHVKAAALGSVSIETIDAVLATRKCQPLSGLDPKIEELTTPGEEQAEAVSAFTLQLAAESKQFRGASEAYGAWIMRVRDYKRLCGAKLDKLTVAALTETARATVTEEAVEKAMRSADCSTLTMVDAGNMWPFKQRFSLEVVGRKFTDAEVTRRLWIKMLSSYKKECVKRLSERQKIAVEAQVDKLQRIVGLDDNILVDLRGKLLDARRRSISAMPAPTRASSTRCVSS
jgi:hypothetical protein